MAVSPGLLVDIQWLLLALGHESAIQWMRSRFQVSIFLRHKGNGPLWRAREDSLKKRADKAEVRGLVAPRTAELLEYLRDDRGTIIAYNVGQVLDKWADAFLKDNPEVAQYLSTRTRE